MNSISVEKLIQSKFTEPTFYVNFYKVGRPTANNNGSTHKILKSNNLLCWKVENEKLIKDKKEYIGIFFDSESYIIQWFFDLKIDKNIFEESLVYYWKGQHALKGYTPLPPQLEEHCPVERIVQWSEPAIFFYCFQHNIVFSGKEEEFDLNAPHLLLARGELSHELHFYEVPFKKTSLRSRASFLLIIPKKNYFVYWHGSQTPFEYLQKVVDLCQPHSYLSTWQNSWADFSVHEQVEGNETDIFLDTFQGDHSDFIHLQLKADFSPKLFYLNTITGQFLATEVEYPLRAPNEVASFPFLQSHLYSAVQPALFLLDNNTELWLWEGIKTTICNGSTFEEELKLAKELQEVYAKEKGKFTAHIVTCFHVHAHKEPDQFKNIFPFWNES